MAEFSEFFDAVKKGDLTRVNEFLSKDRGIVNARTANGFSAVTLAAYYGKDDVLKAVLALRPTLTLHEAAIVGDLERVMEFVEQDANLASDTSAPDGFSPLGLAAHFGRRDVAEYLIAKGADVNFAARESGFTALTGAIAGGHPDLVRILIEAGADVNHRYEEQQFSPLITAAADGDPEIVEMLIASGADTGARTKDGKTAVSMALERGHPRIAEILRNQGGQ